MPKHKNHNYIDKLFLGQPYPEVHRALDAPYVFLGRKHRSIFHTPPEAYVLGTLASSNREGGLSGLLHISTDKLCSKDKGFKKWLDYVAKMDAMQQKQMRQLEKLRAKEEAMRRKRARKQARQHAKFIAKLETIQQKQMKESAKFQAKQIKIWQKQTRQLKKRLKKRRW